MFIAKHFPLFLTGVSQHHVLAHLHSETGKYQSKEAITITLHKVIFKNVYVLSCSSMYNSACYYFTLKSKQKEILISFFFFFR